MTFDPILVEKVAYLLNEIMQDNPNVSRLYLTGVFFFIMMYTGSNVLPIAKFLKYTHIKQAFRSDEVNLHISSLMKLSAQDTGLQWFKAKVQQEQLVTVVSAFKNHFRVWIVYLKVYM